ncbi:MAG: glycosyl hydrolase family protein, partial [Bacteroidetes bacterium]|nr:glycosyl hydrolase family protein [Bacteroidota bacterium]
MKILTLFMPFSANRSASFTTFKMRFLLCIALFFGNMHGVTFARCSSAPKSPQIDSTRDGFGRAKVGMYFKKNWDFRNAIIGLNARWSAKNSQTLILPKKIRHYKPVFEDSFNVWNADIWSKGQPWGRFHPDNVHQFYGDPQVFVGNGCLHLLNEPIPTPVVLESQPPNEQERMKRAQIETNAILPNLVKTGWVDAQGRIVASSQSNIDEASAIASQTQSQNSEFKPAILIPYSIGLANTFHSKNFTYGFFAIRSKNPSGPATWPAWWLTGRNNWPPEIDIFEMYGGATG